MLYLGSIRVDRASKKTYISRPDERSEQTGVNPISCGVFDSYRSRGGGLLGRAAKTMIKL